MIKTDRDYVTRIKTDPRVKYAETHSDAKTPNVVYRFDSDFGTIFFRFISRSLYNSDVFITYRRHRKGTTFINQMVEITTAKSFYETYFTAPPLTYAVLCESHPGHTKGFAKPEETKNAVKIGSVKFLKTSNTVYAGGDDLILKCGDYFSPSLEVEPEDIGTPLEYRVKKYCDRTVIQKFVYPDSWGDIILRVAAWVKFSGYFRYMDFYGDWDLSRLCCGKIQRYHNFEEPLPVEWENMMKQVYRVADKHRKNQKSKGDTQDAVLQQ